MITDLKVGRDGPLSFVGLKLGHVVAQIDVHVFDDVGTALVGHLQLDHVVRATVVGLHVRLLLHDAVPAVHYFSRHE